MSNASKEATEMNETTAPPDTRTRQPPQEMRKIAASPGIGLVATLEARGHAELEARAATSYLGG